MNSEKINCAGFGGQGVMLIGQLLAYAANEEGFNTLWYPSYGPETRGGTANCSVTISKQPVNSPVISKADSIIIMNKPSLDKFEDKVRPDGKIFINSTLVNKKVNRSDVEVFYIPVNDMAAELGNPKVANLIMLGAYLESTKLFEDEVIIKLLKKSFGENKAHLIPINQQALQAGRIFIRQ
ncbi:MAG: porC [Haloplasmataceae bacterium]|jgi:2-oxoglutarate ferredoxin oxidoreductase subunit gamma|nr:porC [Haloplasmataceae bacterium]